MDDSTANGSFSFINVQGGSIEHSWPNIYYSGNSLQLTLLSENTSPIGDTVFKFSGNNCTINGQSAIDVSFEMGQIKQLTISATGDATLTINE